MGATETMRRFAVQWLVPAEPDRQTHVMLLDRKRPAPYVFAAGHGVDKAHALLNLLTALEESNAIPEVIDYVAVEYRRRTGSPPTSTP